MLSLRNCFVAILLCGGLTLLAGSNRVPDKEDVSVRLYPILDNSICGSVEELRLKYVLHNQGEDDVQLKSTSLAPMEAIDIAVHGPQGVEVCRYQLRDWESPHSDEYSCHTVRPGRVIEEYIPIYHWFRLKPIAPGDYRIVATLKINEDEIVADAVWFRLLPPCDSAEAPRVEK